MPVATANNPRVRAHRFRPAFRWMALLCALVCTPWAGAIDPSVMETPDEKEMLQGARSLQDGYPDSAFKKFQRAARYGNKLAQQHLGLMCFEGTGVKADRARAYAWFRLSASFNEDQYTLARDKVFELLTEEEKAKADKVYKKLEEEYGDVEALKRRKKWVQKEKRKTTGSRVGAAGTIKIEVKDALGNTTVLTGAEYQKVLEDYISELEDKLERQQAITPVGSSE